ncbi:hypothetical protein Cgig2_012840 [Carnegiea gigantea]|uniref:Uncharacterized protein n=1 Tax=Carnegiea gigantea TaxID=171969 RepID=A0A9Q1QFU3_9CARY|nr:hypothetical protein Cgig2_012840 [Carnegiea gigantea]
MIGDTKFTILIKYRGWSISLDRDRDEYSVMDLVRDAHAFLNKPPIERRPQFVSLSSHPPNKPSLKWPVNSDNDLMKMFDKWKGRKRVKLVIIERKSPTVIDKLLLQLDGRLGGINVDGIDESQLHSTLSIVLNVPLSTEASIPLNTPCSSLPTPSSHKADLTEAQVRSDGYGKDVMVSDEDGESDDEFEGESSGSEGLEGTESDGSGVIAALRDIFPVARRRIYLVHFMRNFKKLHSAPKLSLLLSRAAKAYLLVNHKKFIECLQKESPVAYTWTMEEPIEHWYRHTFETTTKDDCTSMNAPSPQLPRRSPRKVASTEPSKNKKQGNFESSSTPLSRITIATTKKPTIKRRPQNASSSQDLSCMSLDELRAAVL